jgi:hypothetical protein
MSAVDEFEDDELALDAPDFVADVPEVDVPEADVPEVDVPEVDVPEADVVEVEEDLVVPPPVRSLTLTAR